MVEQEVKKCVTHDETIEVCESMFFENNDVIVIIKNVPMQKCTSCGLRFVKPFAKTKVNKIYSNIINTEIVTGLLEVDFETITFLDDYKKEGK